MFIVSRILACFAGRLLVLFLFISIMRFLLGVVLVLHVRVSRIVIGSRRNSLYIYFVFRDSKHASIQVSSFGYVDSRSSLL